MREARSADTTIMILKTECVKYVEYVKFKPPKCLDIT